MAVSQTGTLTETPFSIRQLESERIVREMVGWIYRTMEAAYEEGGYIAFHGVWLVGDG